MRVWFHGPDRLLSSLPKVPAGKLIHAIVDNYATHKHPNVMKWLARHPRWTFQFTPTSASWLNAVEGFFSTITRRKIRRGVFKSVANLQDAIAHYIEARALCSSFLFAICLLGKPPHSQWFALRH